ncbi:hypothetical protein [Arthrobacter nitrophenolicus]|uniref:hypothetical protein n=1 Tax=Arthrobacter nitrophenolicus TaxID=683150 RepID=UPI00034DCBFE|nr:hypothetical protein [Arthrobacter nitrophenolicus]
MGTRRGGRGWQRTAAALCAAVLVATIPGCIGPPEPPDPDKPAAIALLEAFSSRMVDDGAPAVLFAVTSGGDTWTHAAGVRNLAAREAATVADPVHVGTITESMVLSPCSSWWRRAGLTWTARPATTCRSSAPS